MVNSLLAASKRRSPQTDLAAESQRGAPLERLESSDQFGEVEGLHQIVVRAGVESFHAVDRRVASGENQYRRQDPDASDQFQRFDAATFGHPPVQHRNVVVVVLEHGRRRLSVTDGVDDIARFAQTSLQDFAKGAVIFGDENSHRAPSFFGQPHGDIWVSMASAGIGRTAIVRGVAHVTTTRL